MATKVKFSVAVSLVRTPSNSKWLGWWVSSRVGWVKEVGWVCGLTRDELGEGECFTPVIRAIDWVTVKSMKSS